MAYPLPNWKERATGYGFGVKTSYSDFHLGIDKWANYEKTYAVGGGVIAALLNGKQGGLTVWLKLDNGKLVRYLHLSKFLVSVGQRVKEGQAIAITGNTGLSTGAHLHVDVSKDGNLRLWDKNNFENPEIAFTTSDKLPVDLYYGQRRNLTAEVKTRTNVWLIGKIKRVPTWREVKALVYGHWDFEAVYQNRVGDKWLFSVKE